MTLAEELFAKRKEINRKNKARSQSMEREVARILGGRRVPMSGAGSMKGDCEIETEKVGRIYVECKYSAQSHKVSGPSIRLDYRWFDKMEKDALSMKAKFPVLIVQYGDIRFAKYVILREEIVHRYATDVDYITNAKTIDTGERNGLNLLKSEIDTHFSLHDYPVVLLHCIKGAFVIMHINVFKEIINDPDHEL